MNLSVIFSYLSDLESQTNVILWRKKNNSLDRVPLVPENICRDSYVQIDYFDTGIMRLDHLFDLASVKRGCADRMVKNVSKKRRITNLHKN